MASEGFHEAADALTPETRDMHRAVISLMEEFEATDWYSQRIDVTHDAELREILRHNRNEEYEHAAMLLEWIRRRAPNLDAKLREYLYSEGRIADREAGGQGPGAPANGPAPRMTIGSLRGGR
jgi:uncharacterized protein